VDFWEPINDYGRFSVEHPEVPDLFDI